MSEGTEIHGASKEAAPSEDKVAAPLWASTKVRQQLAKEEQHTPPTKELDIHPAANLIRKMTGGEYQSLKLDMQERGLLVPIKLLDGKILDGRNRYKACLELNIPATTEDVDSPNGFDAEAYVKSLNGKRRHLSTLDRARLANAEATLPANRPNKSHLVAGYSQSEVGKKWGVSPFTMRQVKKIDEATAPETVAQLETGEISIKAAYQMIAKPSTVQQSCTSDWYTPLPIIEAARATMGQIDLDPASCAAANETVKATRFFTKDDAALNQEWTGRVWMNPPYGHPICGQLIDKLLDSPGVEQAIVLCQDSTDTGWWQKLVSRSAVFCFAKKRINFIPSDGSRKQGSPRDGSTLFGIDVDPQKFIDRFGSLCHSFNMGEHPLRQVNAVEPPAEKKLVAAVENGEVSTEQAANKLADREARRNRNLEAERKREERANLPASDGMDIYHCSCGELAEKVEPATVDVICTDPPYGKEFLPCWSELAEFAVHALRPGGQLLALSGQAWLPEVIDRLRVDGLTYRWTCDMQYKGASSYRSFDRQIQSDWKPVLIFEKPGGERLGGHYCHDVVRATAPDADKDRHRWGQNEDAFRDLLGKFVDPGMTVCDPFVGGGTTALVARELGCSFVVCDVDAECVTTTWNVVSGLLRAA